MLIDGIEFSEVDIGRYLWMRVNVLGGRVVRLASLDPLTVEGMDGVVIEPSPNDLSIGLLATPLPKKPDKIKKH